MGKRDLSGYGLYGNGNIVCSEADRWVLVNSGRKIPETASPLKRLLGIHYGPANFFSDENNFIITPYPGSRRGFLLNGEIFTQHGPFFSQKPIPDKRFIFLNQAIMSTRFIGVKIAGLNSSFGRRG